MPDFPPLLPVDEEVLALVAHQACFAADHAAINHMNDVSSVHRPDGSEQSLTPAELTGVAVRAALRNLIANGLIETKSLEETRQILERGVTLS